MMNKVINYEIILNVKPFKTSTTSVVNLDNLSYVNGSSTEGGLTRILKQYIFGIGSSKKEQKHGSWSND